MKNEKNEMRQQVLRRGARIDSQTVFDINGDVTIYPCHWSAEELEGDPLTKDTMTKAKGRMTYGEDGTSRFHAYRQGTGERYRTLLETESGGLLRTQRSLVVKLKLPLALGQARLLESLGRQTGEIMDYVLLNLK